MLELGFCTNCKILTLHMIYENFFIKMFEDMTDMSSNFRKSKLLENCYSFIMFEIETKYKVHFIQTSSGQILK